MKIAISLVMDVAKSGSWQVIKNIIEKLKDIDKENEYFLYVERNYNNDLGKMPSNFNIIRTSITAAQPIFNIIWHTFILPFHLLKNRIDVLHLPWHSAAFLIKIKPTVLTILDLTEYRLKHHYSFSRTLYRKIMIPISSRLVDRIITISEYTKNEILRILGLTPQKVTVIPCAAGDQYKPKDKFESRNFLRDRYGITQPFILYVGQIQHPNKNLIRLLHAFRRLISDLGVQKKLVLVGKKHPSGDIVYQTVNRLRLNQDVIFTGYVQDEDLPYFYNGADLFIYPSLFEGFGIPPLEALSCGTPVISSCTSALPEVIGNAGILVDPFNEDEIATSIYKVLSDERVQEKLRIKGIERAKTFSWEESAKKVLEIYENVYRS